jgi:hypothetical protein
MEKDTAAALEKMQAETDADLAAMQAETDAELERMQNKANQDLAELEKRTRRVMRDLGFNLRIVHRNTDMGRLFANFVAFDMPEEYVQRLAESPQITKIVHLVATLKQMVEWEGEPRLLVGFAPEAVQSHLEKKAPMGFQIKPGAVYLGHIAGNGREVGQTVEILGKRFEIARILPPHGTAEEDIAICMHLKDAQEVLNKPGKISEILALGCKCNTVERLEVVTAQLEAVLPEARITEMRLQAIARQDQRNLVEGHYAQAMEDYRAHRAKIAAAEAARRREIIEQEKAHREQVMAQEATRRREIIGLLAGVNRVVAPLVILACAIWVGLLAWSNVRERRTEIGLLRALGKGSFSIAALFLGKAILLGLVGGVFGCLLGFLLARALATSMFDVALENSVFYSVLAACTIAGAPLIAAMASYLPTLSAVNQDPAVVLMEN